MSGMAAPITPQPGPGDEGFIRHAGRAFLLTFYAAWRALKL